jgi:DNA invertase Pin-like site-specific DNA recombinase
VAAPTALIYCRISRSGQEEGSSLETQEAACRDYYDRRGYEVVAVFREVHTGSEIHQLHYLDGKTGARPDGRRSTGSPVGPRPARCWRWCRRATGSPRVP